MMTPSEAEILTQNPWTILRKHLMTESDDKTAETIPPTALPADVYLDRLERLLHENARLNAYLGETLGVLRGVSATGSEDNIGGAWCEAAVDPVIARLEKLLL